MAGRADKQSSQPSVSKLLSQRAQHHGVVSGVAGQNPAFSMAARLAVRWVAAHMMAGIHLPVEAIELIMTAAFLPTTAAVSPPGKLLTLYDAYALQEKSMPLHVFHGMPWIDQWLPSPARGDVQYPLQADTTIGLKSDQKAWC